MSFGYESHPITLMEAIDPTDARQPVEGHKKHKVFWNELKKEEKEKEEEEKEEEGEKEEVEEEKEEEEEKRRWRRRRRKRGKEGRGKEEEGGSRGGGEERKRKSLRILGTTKWASIQIYGYARKRK